MDVRDRRRGNAIVARQRQDVFAREMRGESRKTASSVDPQDAGREALDNRREIACRLAAFQRGEKSGQPEQSVRGAAVLLGANENIGCRQRMAFVTARRAQRSCCDSAQLVQTGVDVCICHLSQRAATIVRRPAGKAGRGLASPAPRQAASF